MVNKEHKNESTVSLHEVQQIVSGEQKIAANC